MNGFRKLFVISAVVFIVLGVALAAVFIVGIWSGFDREIVAKCLATLGVLFLLAGFLLVVAQSMCEKPKDKV
jgi:hypothetical protein